MHDTDRLCASGDAHRLTVWGLAAFRTTSFVLAAILWVHTHGSLSLSLQRLDTMTGFALFAALWTTTWLATRGGVRHVEAAPDSSGMILMSAIVAGGWNGLYVFGILDAGFLVRMFGASGSQAAAAMPVMLFGTAIGGALAFTIGAVVGLAYGALDVLRLTVCRWLLGWAGARGSSPDHRLSQHGAREIS